MANAYQHLLGTSLEEVRDILVELNTMSADHRVDARQVSNVDLTHITTPEGKFLFTDDAIGQVASRADIPKTAFYWLRENHPTQALSILQNHWDKYVQGLSEKSGQLLIRTRTVGEDQVARAVLTNRYGIIDSLDLVNHLLSCLPSVFADRKISGMKSHVWLDYVTGAINLKGILDDVVPGSEKDKHSFGFVANNDECGHGSAGLNALINRFFCTNQFQSQGMYRGSRQAHIAGAKTIEEFGEKVEAWATNQLEGATNQFAKYWNLQKVVVDQPDKTLVKVGQDFGLPKRDLIQVVETKLPIYLEKDGHSAYAIVNSLTEFARDMQDRAAQAYWEETIGKMPALRQTAWAL